MKEFIKRLLEKWSCCHEWETYSQQEYINDYGESWIQATLICKKCGKIKQIKL